jgi:hypothetical protein
MNRNLPRCVTAAMLGAAIVAATPAMARGGFGGGGGGHGFGVGGHMSMGAGHFGPTFTGRSMAMGSFNRADRFDRDDRFRHFHRFRNRFAFVNGFDDFAFFGVPFGYGYAAYGSGCWRWDGWQWINICYGYNYGY